MHVLYIAVCLAAVSALVLLLRQRWWQLRPLTRRLALALSFAAIAMEGLLRSSGWSFSSNWANGVLYWAVILGYELLLARFSLMRPRWLTATIGLVLALPLLSASIFLPLGIVFDRTPHTVVPLGRGLYSERVRLNVSPIAVSGVDFDVYTRSRLLPFFRRRHQGARLYDTQCDTAETSATLQPDGKTLLVTCPPWPGQPAEDGRVVLVRLY